MEKIVDILLFKEFINDREIGTLSELKDYIMHLEDIERYYREVTKRINDMYQRRFGED